MQNSCSCSHHPPSLGTMFNLFPTRKFSHSNATLGRSWSLWSSTSLTTMWNRHVSGMAGVSFRVAALLILKRIDVPKKDFGPRFDWVSKKLLVREWRKFGRRSLLLLFRGFGRGSCHSVLKLGKTNASPHGQMQGWLVLLVLGQCLSTSRPWRYWVNGGLVKRTCPKQSHWHHPSRGKIFTTVLRSMSICLFWLKCWSHYST